MNNGNPTHDWSGKVVDGYHCASDADFDKFVGEADSEAGFEEAYKNATVRVWSKKTDSVINIAKAHAVFKGLAPELLYDVLHDAEYRHVWDENMIDGHIVQILDPKNEIGYYSAKVPTPVSDRDFLNLRAWRVTADKEWIIMNHSVTHKDCPEKKGFVRAWSIMTGYIIRRTPDGCIMIYLTQSDPRGWIPGWLSNALTTKFAPKLIDKLYQASLKYPDWKKKNNPDHKPWLA